MPSSIRPGETIDRYRIIEPIGKGGMGEVYKAWDATLDRHVALKVLPPEMVRSEERVRRFVQEAKSASSLNHPHIVTIHDIGEARLSVSGDDSSVRYIAMELVDGETLREKIHTSRTDVRTIIGWLAQAAEGLAKAHAAGIVHRDLKPDNVMITRDGYAKVLDFGLAKLVERSATFSQDDPTVDVTREGFIVGTIGYMSPEQIEAHAVDARSDVFSFGCILYEAATRRKPFQGASEVDVMHRIVHGQPEPIDDTTVPADLRRIIRRCLAKSPDERIQSMKDVAIELREIVANWDQLSTVSDPSRSKTVILRAPEKKRFAAMPLVAVIAIVIMAAGAFFAYRALRKPHFTLEKLKIDKLTNSGNVIDFELTPDGKYLVQQTVEDGQFSVWLKQTATGSNVRIVQPSPVKISGVSVSPDGNYVYYVRADNRTSRYQSLYRVAALGGQPVRINSDAEAAPGFSADGTRIAFLRMEQTIRQFRIVTANADGTEERVIAKMLSPFVRVLRPSWSPDGKRIAFVTVAGANRVSLFDSATGARTTIGPPWRTLTGVAWLPDGSGMIVSGIPSQSSTSCIAFLSYPGGEVTTLRSDTTAYTGVSIAADGKSIAAGQQIRFSTLSIGDPNGENLKSITAPDVVVTRVASATEVPIFVGEDASGYSVWVVDPPGTPRKLETTKSAFWVWASRDGQKILFQSNVSGKTHIYFIRPDGSGLRQLTNGERDTGAAISPDGTTMMYLSGGRIWRQPVDGGAATVFADHALNGAAFSPDGRYVAITKWHEDAEHRVVARELILPAEGGAPIADNPIFAANRMYHWGPEPGSYVYFDDVGNANVFMQSEFSKAPPKQLTHFSGGRIFDVGFSPDGKRMYLARGERRNDVVLISDFR